MHSAVWNVTEYLTEVRRYIFLHKTVLLITVIENYGQKLLLKKYNTQKINKKKRIK